MMTRRMALLGATILGAFAWGGGRGAQAQPISGLYIGAGVGYSIIQDQDATVDATVPYVTPQKVPTTTTFKGGIAGVASIGYGVGNGLRLEIEGSARSNQQRQSKASATTSNNNNNNNGTPAVTPTTGSENKYGVMVNILYDADVGLTWLYPYVGVGAGYQFVSWTNVGVLANGVSYFSGSTAVTTNSNLGKPAYQAILGASFPIEQVAGLSLTAEYRFMGITGTRAYPGVATFPFGTPANTHIRASTDNNHTFLIGLRYAFDVNQQPVAPPAAPVPQAYAPAPAAVRTYLVFFDFDSAQLTQRARDIVAEAVQASARIQHTRIEVAGNADAAGSSAYNQAISQRRADVVAAEMMRWGVPRSVIDIHAYGDTRPLVPTAAGVREPQNRRVEITYR